MEVTGNCILCVCIIIVDLPEDIAQRLDEKLRKLDDVLQQEVCVWGVWVYHKFLISELYIFESVHTYMDMYVYLTVVTYVRTGSGDWKTAAENSIRGAR